MKVMKVKSVNSILVLSMFTLICCTNNSSQHVKGKRNSKNEHNVSLNDYDDFWCVEKNKDQSGGGYVLNLRRLNDTVSSFRAFYLIQLGSKSMNTSFDRDSSFVFYYNNNTHKIYGFYDEESVAKKDDSLGLVIKDNGEVEINLHIDTYKSRHFDNELFQKYKPDSLVKRMQNGDLFYISPGNRYYYRLKKKVVEDNGLKNIALLNGASRFEVIRFMDKNLLIDVPEIVTDGSGYYYEIVNGDTTKYKIIGFGDGHDDQAERFVYKYQYWITEENFYKYFERF